MSSGDLLEDLRSNRQRALVPERDDPLLKPEPIQIAEPTAELERSASLSPQTSLINESQSQPELANQERRLDNYPDKLRRLTIRVDEEACLKLDALCSRETLTAEVLVEALLFQYETNPNLMKKVLKDAKERYRKRKQAGVKKRVASMQQKYGDGS